MSLNQNLSVLLALIFSSTAMADFTLSADLDASERAERGVQEPITHNANGLPQVQQAYLKASNTDAGDRFAWDRAIAVDGDTVAIGAHYEGSDATGANGDEANNDAERSGAVYVFVRSADGWNQQAYLKASNTDATDIFGLSVALDGDTLVVGAPFEYSNATGVNGDETNNGASTSGAAYVFVRSNGKWSQQAYLKASNTGINDQFGTSVAVDGDTVVVGAQFEDSNATGIGGNQNSNSAERSGAAYVFVRDSDSWSQQAYLKASNTDADDQFGSRLALSGDTLIVSAPFEDSSATGVQGDQSDNEAEAAGAVYVFSRSGEIWSQQAYLKASNAETGDFFGHSIAIDDDTVVVGANLEDSSATGVNGDEANNGAEFAGAAYVFVRNNGSWSQQAYLKASNNEADDRFGSGVGVDGNTIVVGGLGEGSNSTGVDGNQFNNQAGRSGAAYVFSRSSGQWRQRAYIKASNTGALDQFGASMALEGSLLVVGARFEDSDATGINGDQSNNNADGAGAAYAYDLLPILEMLFSDRFEALP